VNFINMDESGTSSRARAAGWRWLNWPLSVAFDTWHTHALEQKCEHSNELKATSFLCFALALKGLEGFSIAVQAARSKNTAHQHRSLALKASAIKAWHQAAHYLKVSRFTVSQVDQVACVLLVDILQSLQVESMHHGTVSMCMTVRDKRTGTKWPGSGMLTWLDLPPPFLVDMQVLGSCFCCP
jgi:hypothetical protein